MTVEIRKSDVDELLKIKPELEEVKDELRQRPTRKQVWLALGAFAIVMIAVGIGTLAGLSAAGQSEETSSEFNVVQEDLDAVLDGQKVGQCRTKIRTDIIDLAEGNLSDARDVRDNITSEGLSAAVAGASDEVLGALAQDAQDARADVDQMVLERQAAYEQYSALVDLSIAEPAQFLAQECPEG